MLAIIEVLVAVVLMATGLPPGAQNRVGGINTGPEALTWASAAANPDIASEIYGAAPELAADALLAAKGAGKLSPETQRGIRSLEKQIAKHEQKLADFKTNPTVRPGMEGQPKEVIEAAQQARIRHLEKEIQTFGENIKKLQGGDSHGSAQARPPRKPSALHHLDGRTRRTLDPATVRDVPARLQRTGAATSGGVDEGAD